MKSNIITGKRKLLIIEDNELNREMLCTILAEKYEIVTAENHIILTLSEAESVI